jgi:peptidoglycan/xylan/chitin deacetylase (PgdA/CDA1 family)
MLGAMARRTFPLRVAATALALGVVGCTGAIPPLPVPPPVHLTIDGKPYLAPPGSTLGTLIARRHLHARNGRLLSVTGAVLDADVDPGTIELNGVAGLRATRLRDGDRIVVDDGTDRTEPVKREAVQLSGRHPGDPEFTLATYPVTRISETGRVSGDVVSVKDVTSGPGVTPGSVALTFDDGPWPVATFQVMHVLEHFHVPATFFEIGDLVQRYPSITRAVEAAGFEVGDHSWDHPLSPPLNQLHPAKITSEIVLAKRALQNAGVNPTLFRPPGGSYSDAVVQDARAQGMRVVLWSVDPQDWRSGLKPKQVARAVLSHVEAGSIVLLHDGGGDAAHTIAALPAIIRGIRKRGLGFSFVPATG